MIEMLWSWDRKGLDGVTTVGYYYGVVYKVGSILFNKKWNVGIWKGGWDNVFLWDFVFFCFCVFVFFCFLFFVLFCILCVLINIVIIFRPKGVFGDIDTCCNRSW